MKIATIGSGNIGGGLGAKWAAAGHEVTQLGSEGGAVSAAEVVLLAVPGGAVVDALGAVEGLDGKTVIDATNLIGTSPPQGFASNAEFVKSRTNGPTAKSFNVNFAALFDQIDAGLRGAEQPLVWGRGGTRGGRAAEPRRRQNRCAMRWSTRRSRRAFGLAVAIVKDGG